jgi:hypothetical protein
MARLICSGIPTAEIATISGTKTLMQVIAPTNQRLVVRRWGVFFDGVSVTQEPIQVELVRQTTAGTPGTAAAAGKLLVAGSETPQGTFASNYSAEPTTTDVLDVAEVHPQTGYEAAVQFEGPIEIPGGGRLGMRCIATVVVNARCKIIWEE